MVEVPQEINLSTIILYLLYSLLNSLSNQDQDPSDYSQKIFLAFFTIWQLLKNILIVFRERLDLQVYLEK
jgi:hypothetical protein